MMRVLVKMKTCRGIVLHNKEYYDSLAKVTIHFFKIKMPLVKGEIGQRPKLLRSDTSRSYNVRKENNAIIQRNSSN